MKVLGLSLFSYLLGSIPCALIFANFFGQKDLRKEGSGNVGATNALVVGGPLAGGLSLVCDIAKGLVPVLIARLWVGTDMAVILAAFFVVLGHDFPVFLKFKGGKGVATTAGILIGIDPIMFLFIILLWILVLIVVRHFIPSTVIAIALIPLFMWFGSYGFLYIILGIFIALLAIFQHRGDIDRFLKGEEKSVSESIAGFLNK